MYHCDSMKPTPLGRLRFATVQDATGIVDLVNESVSRTFRVNCLDDIIYLIENAILSICQLDAYDIIIGFASARDYPQTPAVHPSAWENYIWTKYKAIELNARNTLFLHMLCWNPLYGREVVDSLLRSMFMHDAYIHHIGILKSLYQYPHLVPGQFRSEASFRRIHVLERGVTGERLPALLVADRKEMRFSVLAGVLSEGLPMNPFHLVSPNFDFHLVSPNLSVGTLCRFNRECVILPVPFSFDASSLTEEDNDDLVPLFHSHAPQLKELYGEFYISELISKHPESDRVLLVCEHKELAVGMMCLNTTINYDGLAESFVLEPYGGLKHLDSVQGYNRDLDDSMSSFFNDLQSDTSKPQTDHRQVKIVDDQETDLHHEWSERRITRQVSLMGNNPEEIMTLLLQDEESAMEFDIVNIESEHLWVPEFLCNALTGTSEAIQKIIDDFTPPKKTKKERKTASSVSTVKTQKNTGFNGAPNAFLIELFAIQPEYDERYGFDILEASFELFPDRDYCIICLPSHQAPFPLLEHFTLVTPVESRPLFKTDSLYVAHINSIRGKLCVRPGERYDLPALERVLQNAPKSATILNLYQSTLSTSQLQSFVFLSENQPIGVVVIGPLDDGTTVRTQYDLEPEPRRPGTDGTVLAGVMSPALEPHSRWFLREIMRQSRYSTLFWICTLFARDDAAPSRNLMSLASYMNPVHPRKVMPNISQNKDLDKMFQGVGQPFALWIIERPMTGLPKIHVNCSIVVVGASRTGLSFLEALIMGPTSEYLTFSNVTLVSEHGLPTVGDCLKAADTCVPRDGRYTDRYIKSVPFYFYVDVVSGVMVGIDRKRKCIQLKDGSVKNYDQLVLTCGQQFQHPEYLADALYLVKQVQAGKPCDRILMDNPMYQEDRVPPPPELPNNVYLINSLYEANCNLGKLMRLKNDTKHDGVTLCPENPVVVYGDCIEAYSCVAALLELGIPSKNIVFVEPFPSSDDQNAMRVNCFNNETVDERVQAKLEDIGITVYRRYHFEGWKLVLNDVERLYFMSTLHAMSIKCFALFYFGRQAINMHAFKAINESGLVYDGGLVVSPTFETNDPNIYGAGTCVSYSRRLYATRALHRNFCSEDIGEALAKLFLRKLDPFVEHFGDCDLSSELIPTCTSSILGISMPSASTARIWSETPASYRRWQPVMKFKSPLFQYATLPGPLYYLKIRKSGKEIPVAVQKILPRQGHTLRTDYNGNYFRLQLNVLHEVDAVTCLSAKPFSPDIISDLFGKHEAIFNKLLDRYKSGMIQDLYDFFTQPWMSALYQESFKELNECINEQDVLTVTSSHTTCNRKIGDLTKSKYTTFDEGAFDTSMRRMTDTSMMSTASVVSTTDSIRRMGTFRSLIQKYIARYNKDNKLYFEDVPKECGQDQNRHKSALKFWHRVSGNKIVSAHLAKYLDRNNVCNPQYACPSTEPQND